MQLLQVLISGTIPALEDPHIPFMPFMGLNY